MSNCIFCNLSPNKVIAENKLCLAFFDNFPVSQGHTLIIPRRHAASYFELTAEEKASMDELVMEVKALLDEKYHPDGYNLGVNIGTAAGQSVMHVHLHVIPRYAGDVSSPKGGVRGVIPAKQSY